MVLSKMVIEVEEVEEDRLKAVIDIETDNEFFVTQAVFLIIRAHCFKMGVSSGEFIQELDSLNTMSSHSEGPQPLLH